MSEQLTQEQMDTINRYNEEQRLKYCVKEIVANRKVWILKDEHGCVMLNTEDDDCVPVWPNEEFALQWANGDWEDCEPEAISLNKWHSRWTSGLEDDELSVVVFPNQNEEGWFCFLMSLISNCANKRAAANFSIRVHLIKKPALTQASLHLNDDIFDRLFCLVAWRLIEVAFD